MKIRGPRSPRSRQGNAPRGRGAAHGRGYRVRIIYTEPEFQRRRPHAPREFSYLFEFPAAISPDDAARQALSEWDFCRRHTGVGWARVIKSVRVEARPG